MNYRSNVRFVVLVVLSLFSSIGRADDASGLMRGGRLPDEVRDRAVATLREGLAEQQRWVKVHAAEFLLSLSYPQGVRETFEAELESHNDAPEYRVGIWRVLAKAGRTPAERAAYVDQIRAVAVDEDSPVRLHAIESLAKLGVNLNEPAAREIATDLPQASKAELPFVRWLIAISGFQSLEAARQDERMVPLLESDQPLVRLRAAFAMARFPSLGDGAVESLLDAADGASARESEDELARLADAHLLSAAWRAVASRAEADPRLADRVETFRGALFDRAERSAPVAVVLADTLASVGTPTDAEWLASRLESDDADLRLSVAHALLRLDRRRPGAMTAMDWSIIAIYFAGMIGIGVFYAGRTESTDDFLLGGRHMKSWMVGLSLFATLLSTLTYLAVPGEMIRHGPVIVMGLASLPLVAWIVGWFLIPAFMRLRVTSAYEILENRFGFGGRLFGSVMFLALRFFWMAVILYATTDAVIVPLLGWSSASTPWICAVLGVITVVYSSLGGLRAVVLTDVIQTGILLGGAILALTIISLRLGGVTAWWPTEWDPAWTPFRIFDPSSPRTLVMAILATGIWYVCTAGSDQMAIQRYLATRDARAARKMFYITLGMNVTSWLLLTILGFALLGFYRAHPEYLADGSSIAADADKLFPRFIAVGLPAGVSGLVVAGLLAAAMSSLSSGINSSCAVISVDYVGRLRQHDPHAEPGLKETQIISWGIGVVAVLLSMAAGFVPGNLLDVVYRIGNLLVAPLFVLFFLALFVKRASWTATWIGVIASIAVAVTVAYGELIGQGLAALLPGASGLADTFRQIAAVGVLWIMPASLVTGIAVGWLGSLAGIGRPAPPLASEN